MEGGVALTLTKMLSVDVRLMYYIVLHYIAWRFVM